MLALLLVLPLAGGVAIALGPRRSSTGWFGVAANAAVLALGVMLAVKVTSSGPVTGLFGVLRVDALSAFMVMVIGAVALLASWLGIRTNARERDEQRTTATRVAAYGVLVQGFIAAMLLAVLAANMGVLWVAVEATTIVTTFLVGSRRTKGSLEAAWKYLIICSVGIALAFFGTVLFYLASLHAGGHSAGALDWTSLVAVAPHLNPAVLRMGFALVVLGYGAKVGLAPLHSWLPDAHSQAPAPVSALMSGVLLTVAFYAILRFKAVVDLAIEPSYSRTVLVIVALLSLGVAASLLIAQRDYKRMLAYSSIEHMGLIALGAAAGTRLAIAAVLLQILGHGLAKTVLFLTSGEIMAVEGTSRIDGVHTLLGRRPALGGLFGFGLVALLGLPPFSLFSSELAMTRAEFSVGLGWVAAVAVGLMVVIFVAIVGHARTMLVGPTGPVPAVPVPAGPGPATAAPPRWVAAPLVGGLVACALLGIFVWPLSGLLTAAAHVVTP